MELKLFESINESKKILKENIPRLVRAHEKNICIVRNKEKITAFLNECPHLRENLHRGKINYANEIVCPLHSYRFDLKSGEEANGRCAALKFVKVKEKSGEIYLEF